ncbi:PREDICTED: uncharacterized protein LOC105585921 [Cercocebus atys]|uniref:uncharacterized protein LOC105585921 n=1 Tax=Cercocebus atys TaxID=9531 RepID=UPI0005F525F4|nr:PREDICTED: uncharacterized protein LOC105585921 [Cercocebus atys]
MNAATKARRSPFSESREKATKPLVSILEPEAAGCQPCPQGGRALKQLRAQAAQALLGSLIGVSLSVKAPTPPLWFICFRKILYNQGQKVQNQRPACCLLKGQNSKSWRAAEVNSRARWQARTASAGDKFSPRTTLRTVSVAVCVCAVSPFIAERCSFVWIPHCLLLHSSGYLSPSKHRAPGSQMLRIATAVLAWCRPISALFLSQLPAHSPVFSRPLSF